MCILHIHIYIYTYYIYCNTSWWYNDVMYHIIDTMRLYVQLWCFPRPALESTGVSASCRASRLWKTPKILAASATPRKPWRPSATVLEKFWRSREAASASESALVKRNHIKEGKKWKQHKNWNKKHVYVDFISQMILSPSLFSFQFIFTTLRPGNIICVPFTAAVFS